MTPKISPSFWADLEGLPPEVKLTMAWCITNGETAASLTGVFTWRPRRFEFDTGLDPCWFSKTCAALPRAFAIHGDRILLTHFISYQLGRGVTLARNTVARALARQVMDLPEELKKRIFELHPELIPIGSPSHPHTIPIHNVAHEELAMSSTPAQRSEVLPISDVDAIPMASTRTEQSSTEQNLKGESEGVGAVVPAEAEVLAFARAWSGEMSRGIPPVMPEGWVLSWLAWRLGETAPPFPRDWRADLTRRFTADWVKKRSDTRHAAINGAPSPPSSHGELVDALDKTVDPEKRRAILALLKTVTA